MFTLSFLSFPLGPFLFCEDLLVSRRFGFGSGSGSVGLDGLCGFGLGDVVVCALSISEEEVEMIFLASEGLLESMLTNHPVEFSLFESENPSNGNGSSDIDIPIPLYLISVFRSSKSLCECAICALRSGRLERSLLFGSVSCVYFWILAWFSQIHGSLFLAFCYFCFHIPR